MHTSAKVLHENICMLLGAQNTRQDAPPQSASRCCHVKRSKPILNPKFCSNMCSAETSYPEPKQARARLRNNRADLCLPIENGTIGNLAMNSMLQQVSCVRFAAPTVDGLRLDYMRSRERIWTARQCSPQKSRRYNGKRVGEERPKPQLTPRWQRPST